MGRWGTPTMAPHTPLQRVRVSVNESNGKPNTGQRRREMLGAELEGAARAGGYEAARRWLGWYSSSSS